MTSGCKDIEIRKSWFVTKNQFLLEEKLHVGSVYIEYITDKTQGLKNKLFKDV